MHSNATNATNEINETNETNETSATNATNATDETNETNAGRAGGTNETNSPYPLSPPMGSRARTRAPLWAQARAPLFLYPPYSPWCACAGLPLGESIFRNLTF